MPTGDRLDPYAQFNVLIEIDGVLRAGFTEVSTLETSRQVIDDRDGFDAPFLRKLPRPQTNPNITLKRGMTTDEYLWKWHKTVLDGATELRSGSIVLLDDARLPALRFNFRAGWICKWEDPQLNTTTNEVAIESLEICHEWLELVG